MSHTIFSLGKKDGKTDIIWNYLLLSHESYNALSRISKIYTDRTFIWLNNNKKKVAKPPEGKTCLFCSKSYPEVKFSNVAHLFPAAAGNRYHISDFECDTCNSKFSIYEQDFINFLGPYRALTELPKRKGYPNFNSRTKSLTIDRHDENTLDVFLNHSQGFDKILDHHDGSSTLILSEGDPFKPINVFKCLLKSAVSLVDTKDIQYLSDTILFLNDENAATDPSLDFILSMHQFFVPGNFNVPPFIISFRKGDAFEKFPAPSFIFLFYIRNLIFQIFIPFHSKDTFFYPPSSTRHLYIVPPLIKDQWFKKFDGPFAYFYNLNTTELMPKNLQVTEWKNTDLSGDYPHTRYP